ncbi:MAG: ABC transporter permease [Vicinamibacterales bacterium]
MVADFYFAFRSLRATPGFTLTALLVLTLGIGATTAVYSVVDAVALRGLPFDDADRLMVVAETNPTGKGFVDGFAAAPNFYDWRAQQKVFDDLAAFQARRLTVRTNGELETLHAMMVSSSLFPMLRAAPAMGRIFPADREVMGQHRVAVISDRLWRSRFAANPNIIGSTFTVGDGTATNSARADEGLWEIVGVMPPAFAFPIGQLRPIDVWTPYVPSTAEFPRGDGSARNYNVQVLGRLKPGVSREQALAQMEQITGALKTQYPQWFRDRWVGVTPLHESIVGRTRSWMLMLLGAVAFVLLIACVNVANLMLTRASARTRDVTVRAALGASRWQLARALLAESLLLSVVGTVLGVGLAAWGVAVLRATLPPALPRLADIGIDLRVLLAASSAALTTGVFFGLLPAIQCSRPQLSTALREGGRSGHVGMRQRAQTVLLVTEVALAVVLLIGAGLFVTSFSRLSRVDLGIDVERVLTIAVSPSIDFSKERIDADMGARRSNHHARARPRAHAAGCRCRGLFLRQRAARWRLQPHEVHAARAAELHRS